MVAGWSDPTLADCGLGTDAAAADAAAADAVGDATADGWYRKSLGGSTS